MPDDALPPAAPAPTAPLAHDGAAPATPPEGVALCAYEDFQKIKLAVAEVVAAEVHPKADKLLKLRVRLGGREKQICAGIRAWYAPEQLLGRRVVVVDNLAPRQLRGEASEGMLLAASAPDGSRLALVTVDDPGFPSGSEVR